MYPERIRCSSVSKTLYAKHDPGSEHSRAPLHHTTSTSVKAPAILECNSPKPLLMASHHWWKHIFLFMVYGLRKAIKRLTYLLGKADLDSVMILLDERRVSTASNSSN